MKQNKTTNNQNTTLLGRCKKTVSVLFTGLALMYSSGTMASNITSMHFFGDSLTDSGALQFINPAFCPPTPYAGCRFSNGPVWAELVADQLGFTAQTAYSGGTNWAIGGQRTDQVLNGQVATYLATTGGVADSSGLYVVWAGANDNFQNDPDGTFDPLVSAENILNSIQFLSNAGATNFLIPNVPIADVWSFTFNTAVAAGLDLFDDTLNIIEFDALSFIADVTLNPGDYGFVNSTDPCFTGMTVCDNPDEYSLWDSVHPTAAGHRLIAGQILDVINASTHVSAPATLVLLLTGLVVLVRRKA